MARQMQPQPQQQGEADDIRRYPPGLRHMARWVHLCEQQGTRLVDLVERWVEATEEGNRQASRLADVAERLAQTGEAYMGTDYHDDEE